MIIGLDAGGTHTDVVLLDRKGLVKTVKIVTDHNNLLSTILSGLEKITEDIEKDSINRVVLSTTLTTNFIVQNESESVGMIVMSGPGINPYDLKIGENFYVASGSINHRGDLIEDIDYEEIEKIGDELCAKNIKYVGIVSKFSNRNPILEINAKKLLNKKFKKIFLGHKISGELNFPRRITTTYLNSLIYSSYKVFFESVKKSLEMKKLELPIYILKADGGTMSLESSINMPSETILSGPAASIMGSIIFAGEKEDVISMDIGGTTTDISVFIKKNTILESLCIKSKNYKTLIRSIKSKSIGVGGDSLVKVIDGKIVIGPKRMGPAMAFGGNEPTVMDAVIVLNKIEKCDKKRAEVGIQKIAEELNMSLKESAQKIFDTAIFAILNSAEEMVREIKQRPIYTVDELVKSEESDFFPKKILIMGTPAKVFADRMNEISQFNVEVVPNYSVANAIGAALSKVTTEITVVADTEKGRIVADGGILESIGKNFSLSDTIQFAEDVLKEKALGIGANLENFEMEILESSEFNVVRGFYATGKNIRVKAQIKPGFVKRFSEENFKILN